MIKKFNYYLQNHTSKAAPLAVFRILFGLILFISMIRFWSKGWIEKFYINPDYHFSYFGFEWVQPLGAYTYLLYVVCLISSFCIALGFKYRVSIVLFFLSFTYIELMDKTMYLNHYYFVSVLSFLLIFLPANRFFSLDAYLHSSGKRADYYSSNVPSWTIDSIKLLLVIIYVYAGLAKLNSDWLLNAMPLSIWLPSKFDVPFIGDLLAKKWVHYAFSWVGAAYDLFIPFLLLWKRTRVAAFIGVLIFHLLTRILFPIGMFPYIMILSATIFFSAQFHQKIITVLAHVIKYPPQLLLWVAEVSPEKVRIPKIKLTILVMFFTFQLLFPWRYLAYPGELFWTEEGYRLSWRVMLMEKSGYAQFKIIIPKENKQFYVDNAQFLTPLQEKQMSFQPDFILEFAHHLRDYYETQWNTEVQVFVDTRVALNGRLSVPLIDPEVNLAKQKESFKHKNWILPFNDDIKGL